MASAGRLPMPSIAEARARSVARKVRLIRKCDASAATFFDNLASRWVAMTPARPRLRPRDIRFAIADSDPRRASSLTSAAPEGADNCADRTSVAWGKSGSVRVDLGGRRVIKKKTRKYKDGRSTIGHSKYKQNKRQNKNSIKKR